MKKKKSLDAVAFMREERKRLSEKWADKPRSEEIEHFKKVQPGVERGRKKEPAR